MIQDKLSMFSEGQAVTASALSETILDLHAHGDDVQRALTLFVQARETVTSGTSASTVGFELWTSDALDGTGAALDAGEKIWASGLIVKTDLINGTFAVKQPLPSGIKRYLQLKYVVSATLTAGTFDAGLAWGIDLP